MEPFETFPSPNRDFSELDSQPPYPYMVIPATTSTLPNETGTSIIELDSEENEVLPPSTKRRRIG
jgi:hypothetical protein